MHGPSGTLVKIVHCQEDSCVGASPLIIVVATYDKTNYEGQVETIALNSLP